MLGLGVGLALAFKENEMSGINKFISYFAEDQTRSMKIVDYPHHEIHGGRAFLALYSLTRDNTEFIEMRFRANHASRRCHMTIHIDAALAATVEMWKNTTKTHVIANAITPMNRDFSNPYSSVLSVCHTPAGAQAGNADLLQYVGSATANGRSEVGGSLGSRSEFILQPFADYLIKATSRANSNALTITLDWYEHTDKAAIQGV